MKKIAKSRNAAFSRTVSKYIVMPQHTNPNGIMFGGVLVSWIDLTAAMVAEKHSGLDVATIQMDQINFKYPIRIGEHVILEGTLIKTGTTSMKIAVVVKKENTKTGTIIEATRTLLTFVGIGGDMKPTAVPKLEEE